MAQVNKQDALDIDDVKIDYAHEDGVVDRKPETEGAVLRSAIDDVSPWQAAKLYKRVLCISMLAAFSASLDGYQINLSGSIVSHRAFIQEMASDKALQAAAPAIDGAYVSAWGGMLVAGQIVGQICLQFATEAYGRKIALYILMTVLAISVGIECAARNWGIWMFAKFVCGAGIGMMQATLPMYLGELAPTQLRGFMMVIYTGWFNIGQLLAPTALRQLKITHPDNWLIAVYTQWAMIGISAVIYYVIPESPWWLVSKGRYEEAAQILDRYQGHVPGFDVSGEIAIMKATCEEEHRRSLATNKFGQLAIFKGTNGWRLIIAAWPKIQQQFVGMNLFNTYATYFFQLAGNKDPFLVTVILTCCQLMAVITTALLTDSIGRRPLTVYPYFVTSLAVLALGIIGFFDFANKTLGSLLIFFACLATFSTTGASAIGYAYLAEIPSQHLRARTTGWGLALSNLFNLMFAFCTPIMLNGPAKWGVKTGLFYGCTGLIFSTAGWFLLPELARRTPAEIDEMFEKKVNPRKFKGFVTDVEVRARAGQVQDA